LLVRLHPSDRPEDYKRFEGKPGLVFQRPGRPSSVNARDWNPTHEDMFGLAETMRYSDVIINVASTITIDASVFDTPVVNIAFDGFQNKPYELSCQRYYKYEHYERIVRTGGVKVAYTPEEMVKFTQAYLDDPTLDSAGRERIRQEQCWKSDGQAGKRIAEYLLEVMEQAKT
jgi:CDP-glycerol glycerophosphotransferase (TagB/SpsB family)